MNAQAAPDSRIIERLVEDGEMILKVFHQEYSQNPTSRETEFWRGKIAGYRTTLHAIYGRKITEDILDKLREKANLPIPHIGSLSPDGRSYLGLDTGCDMALPS